MAAAREEALAAALVAVLRAPLLAPRHTAQVERPANHLVRDATEVLHVAAAHEHDRVLLEVVALARDRGGDLLAVRQADTGHLAQRRVRLTRRRGVHAHAHSAPLGRAVEGRALRLANALGAALADELVDPRHSGGEC